MLPKTQIKKLQNLLSIKNEENAILFLSRLQNWIEKNGNSSYSLAKAINIILFDIHNQEIEQEKNNKKINLSNVKNKKIEKYASKIIELHQKGMGVRKISAYLFEMHRAKISYSSIYRFLKSQKGQ